MRVEANAHGPGSSFPRHTQTCGCPDRQNSSLIGVPSVRGVGPAIG